MIVATEECGHYALDWERLLREVRKAQEQVYAHTARHPCAVELHPADAKEMAVGMTGRADAVPITAIAGIPVVLDHPHLRIRGVAVVRQCELPHPRPQDCPYHARIARVTDLLVKRESGSGGG